MTKTIVKLSYPRSWNIITEGNLTQFHRLTPDSNGEWGNFRFLINDNQVKEVDYWIVIGFLDEVEKLFVKSKTILILSEEAGIKVWDDKFMSQFDVVVGSQKNIRLKNYHHDHYPGGWQIFKNYDQLINLEIPEKKKDLSAIISNLTYTEGHKLRYDFVMGVHNHFRDKLDWFGRGVKALNDKWDGIAPYKYSIAIENQQVEDYWTEKIADCILAYSMPIYYGCKNIDKYFPKGSYLSIDINNINESIEKIQEALATGYYENNLHNLKKARELILNKYQLFPKMVEWINKYGGDERSGYKTLKPESFFVSSWMKRTALKMYRIIAK